MIHKNSGSRQKKNPNLDFLLLTAKHLKINKIFFINYVFFITQ